LELKNYEFSHGLGRDVQLSS